MKTLVESDGMIATAVARKGGRGVAVDRKASFMVQELKNFDMNVIGISESKWFGKDIYDVDGFPFWMLDPSMHGELLEEW